VIAHEIVTSVKIDPGNTTMDKAEENMCITFRNMMVVFAYIKGGAKEKE